jgi:two-component system sensor histidine kinase DegS
MSTRTLDAEVLDRILNTTIDTVKESKTQIYEISEHTRKELSLLKDMLSEIKAQVLDVIKHGDQMEARAKLARNKLATVSKSFQMFSEEQIRNAYETANNLQLELNTVRQKEAQLREKRDDIERRLISLKNTVEKADNLGGQIGVVLNFLSGDLKNFGDLIKDAQQKQEFGLQILEAQEVERRKLSREIHDGPAQQIANALLRSEIIEKVYHQQGPEKAYEEVDVLKRLLREGLREVRRIIYDLRPMALDDLGLIPTLEKYLRTIEEDTGIKISYTTLSLDTKKRLPERMEIALFRLVQESVQNACKHAVPKEIQVRIEMRNDTTVISVKDNGKGFDPKEEKENSFGLIGMKERIEILNGQFSLKSKPNAGTAILIQIPMNHQGDIK